MPKPFLRIVVILLIPCLLVNPSLAGASTAAARSRQDIFNRTTFSRTAAIAKNLGDERESFSQMRSTEELYEGIDQLTKSLRKIYADHGAPNAPEFKRLMHQDCREVSINK